MPEMSIDSIMVNVVEPSFCPCPSSSTSPRTETLTHCRNASTPGRRFQWVHPLKKDAWLDVY